MCLVLTCHIYARTCTYTCMYVAADQSCMFTAILYVFCSWFFVTHVFETETSSREVYLTTKGGVHT